MWAFVTVASFASLREAVACSIIAVGREASASGYPVVTHTDDGGPANDVRLVRVPRKQWPAGSVRHLYNWHDPFPRMVSAAMMTPDYSPMPGQFEFPPMASIPQVEETWAYWDVDYGMQNEWGLSIGESTGNAKTVGWPALQSQTYGYNRIGIEDLSKIALERCKTARCAVETMGALAVEHGFYSADSGDPAAPSYTDSAEILVLADVQDVWIWNVMTGKHNSSAIWGAKRIPPNHVAVIADSFSFSLDFNDPDNNLYSHGVTELADEMGWRKTESEQPGTFDFFLAYGAEITDPQKTVMGYYISRRIWRGYTLLAPEEGAKLNPNQTHLANGGRLPTSLLARPGSVTLKMIMAVHRDHFEGTPYDLTEGMAAGPFGNPNRVDMPAPGQWERAWSLTRTIMSYVLQPRPNGRSIAWFGYDAPHGTVYMPFYGAATASAPSAYNTRAGEMSVFSRDSAWWAFNLVNTWSNLNFRLINGEVRKRAEALEARAEMMIKDWEDEADAAERAIPDVRIAPTLEHRAGLDVLTARSNDFVASTVADWWRFVDYLFAKYSRAEVTYTESEEGRQVYPLWWLDSPEVGFRSWTPEGPFHGIVCKTGDACGSGAIEAAFTSATKRSTDSASSVVQQPFLVSPPVFAAVAVAVAFALSLSLATYWLGLSHGKRQQEGASGYLSLSA